MKTAQLTIWFGVFVTIGSMTCLLGWYFGDWRFVNPFFSTFLLVGGPFFIGMGIVTMGKFPELARASARY